MSRKILIVNQCAHSLTVEIANAFVRSGKFEDVVIATGDYMNPSYCLDENVKLQSIAKYNTKSTYTRLITWIFATIKLIFLCKYKYRCYELFLISNPPIDSFIPNFCKNKYSTLIFDVYPDGLGDFASKDSFVYKIWAKNNIRFYEKAEYVYTLTNSMAKTISQYCPIKKIEVVSLWSSPHLPILNVPKNENKFLLEHPELLGKFIIMYSGNIGLDHDMNCLLDAVKELNNREICLVFIGEGYNKPKLQKKAHQLNMENMCFFYPFQDVDMLPYSLKCADISVVATKPNGRSSSIPSKVFDLIKLGQPILCIADPESEISLLVKKHNIGKSFMVNEIHKIACFLSSANQSPEILDEYRINANNCASMYTNKLAEKYVK